jgi:hypothetical protein
VPEIAEEETGKEINRRLKTPLPLIEYILQLIQRTAGPCHPWRLIDAALGTDHLCGFTGYVTRSLKIRRFRPFCPFRPFQPQTAKDERDKKDTKSKNAGTAGTNPIFYIWWDSGTREINFIEHNNKVSHQTVPFPGPMGQKRQELRL